MRDNETRKQILPSDRAEEVDGIQCLPFQKWSHFPVAHRAQA